MPFIETDAANRLVEAYRERVLSGKIGRGALAKAENLPPWQARLVIDAVRAEAQGAGGRVEAVAAGKGPSPGIVHPGDKTASVGHDGHLEVRTLVSEPVRTLADLFRVCEVDEGEWMPVRWKATAWTTTLKVRTFGPSGKVVGEQPEQKTNHYVTATFEPRKAENRLREVHAELLGDIARVFAGDVQRLAPPRASGKELAVLHLTDLHYGKPGAEHPWGFDEADAWIRAATEDLLDKVSGRAGRILIPLGHDLGQYDNERWETTGGTRVDGAGSVRDVFRAMRSFAVWVVRRAREIAPVDVVEVPGNHSRLLDFALCDLVGAVFEQDTHVRVDTRDTRDKTYRFGDVGLLLTHGDDIAFEKLPQHFAVAHPEIWGQTYYREILTGHLHARRGRTVGDYFEAGGVITRISPALCPADWWHRNKGFVGSIRGVEAFTYDREQGPTGSYAFNIPRRALQERHDWGDASVG